jgi:tetratricopeptide (TPR) repeat protein
MYCSVPPHMMSMDVRRAKSAPLTREAFAAQLAARGFDQAHAIYKEMQGKGASFTLDADMINSWGYELLRMGKQKESIAIFQFGTQLIPQDANLFDSLGEAQAEAGLREDAIRNYNRSLELNPKNFNAVERLKTLKAG